MMLRTRRQTEPHSLHRLIRGDLDWIVMMCLDKDRHRRYADAAGLACDIERHLGNKPVVACPPAAVYRLGKFLRRHRQSVTVAAATAFILLLLGAGLTLVGSLRSPASRAPQHSRSSTNGTLRESSPPRDTATAWDYKTVEFQTDLRQQMSEWQREGWVVLNVSGPITQKDGTITRKASLKRAKQ